MVRGRDPVEDIPVQQAAGEPDPDPGAGLCRSGVRLGHLVVEGPVQMGQRDVDGHSGDGQLGGDHLRTGGLPTGAGGGRCHVFLVSDETVTAAPQFTASTTAVPGRRDQVAGMGPE